MKKSVWSEAEIRFLTSEYPDRGRKYCAEKLGRSYNNICSGVMRLGLKRNQQSEFAIADRQRAMNARGISLWSKREREFLIGNYANLGKKRCAEILKRTLKAVARQASALQLQQAPEVTLKHVLAARRTEDYRQGASDRMVRLIASGKAVVPTLSPDWKRGKRWKQGRRADLNNQFFRSSWEANYARYLNWLKAKGEIHDWQFEADTFWFLAIKRGVRSYLPDFKVWDTPTSEPVYHEIKGWMDPKSVTKLKRMKKYYPKVRVVLIDASQYRSIAKWSKLIPGWENTRVK